MNSLNLLSGRVSAPQTPGPSRSNSYGSIFSSQTTTDLRTNSREALFNDKSLDFNVVKRNQIVGELSSEESSQQEKHEKLVPLSEESRWLVISKKVSFAFVGSIRWILSTLAAPGVYVIANLYDEKGCFTPISQITKLGMILCGGSRRSSTAQALGLSFSNEEGPTLSNKTSGDKRSDLDTKNLRPPSSARRPIRDDLLQDHENITQEERSLCIKVQDENILRSRKQRKLKSKTPQSNSSSVMSASEISPSSLKSPVSPASSKFMSKYPNSPVPPRPLIPRLQPSYAQLDASNGRRTQKTLILDLDETLIHSMAKGGRMSTGHMVEVKLNTIVAADGSPAFGLQHPILYWVNKRPHCDDFLRLVCKWYNLVIFTASVQEYADPVIDLLEQERKLFSGRYYRQHCTYRQGAFIKDLSSIEPDLSKVMILDNSPLSYMFHQENAIPIEGWINDPTDNDLLHLVPLLESLQYVTDVRAFLALRGGEDGKHL